MTERRIRIRQMFSRFAFVTAVVLLLAACGKDNKLTQENISITGTIRGIIIDGPWDVLLTQNDDDLNDNSVLLEYNESERNSITAELLPSGYLHLKISSTRNIGNKVFRAKVKVAGLEKIEMSGAANLRIYNQFHPSADFPSLSCDISLSGASQLDGFDVWDKAGTPFTININLSGASRIKEILLPIGSSVDDNRIINNCTLNAKLSGASEVSFYCGFADNCTVDCSGASSFTATGEAINCSFRGVGASEIKTGGLETETLNIDLSGASNAEVKVTKSAKGSVTGASILKVGSQSWLNPDISGIHVDNTSKLIRKN